MNPQRLPAARRLNQLIAHRFADGGPVQDLRNGGHVRGRGTTTSDSIPAHLSDEEYVLPADTVDAVGVPALEALRRATHRPVRGKGGQRYANGGQVEEKKPNSFGDAQAAAQSPGMVVVPSGPSPAALAPTPMGAAVVAPPLSSTSAVTPAVSFSNGGAGGRANSFGDAAAAIQDPGLTRTAPTGASAVEQIPTSGYQAAPRGESASGSEVGRNLMNAAAALPGIGGVGTVASTGGAVSTALNTASRVINAGSAFAAGGGVPSVAEGGTDTRTAPAMVVAPDVSGAGPGRGTANDPRRLDMDPSRQTLGGSRDFTAELNKVPRELPADMRDNVVIKTIDPKTGSTTYSGRNVGTNAEGLTRMVDGAGRNLKMLGKPTGDFVSAVDANGRATSFAAPGMDGAVSLDGKQRVNETAGGGDGGRGNTGVNPFAVTDKYDPFDRSGAMDKVRADSAAYVRNYRGLPPLSRQAAADDAMNRLVARHGGDVDAARRAGASRAEFGGVALGGGSGGVNGAADRLSARNDGSRGALLALRRQQVQQEVAQAQRINATPYSGSGGSYGINRDPSKILGEMGSISNYNRAKGTDPFSRKLGQKQQELDQAKQFGEIDRDVNQQRLALDTRAANADNAGKQRVGRLQDLVANGDPSQRTSAAEALRALSGKDPQQKWVAHSVQGGQDEKGNRQPGYVVLSDQFTGQSKVVNPNAQATAQPKYKEGQALRGKDGKTYVVRGGVPVLRVGGQ